MMIRHIFIAAVKKGVSEEVIREIAKKLRGLKEKYPTVRAGENLGWYANNTHVALTADFADKKSWEAFVNSPEHAAIAKDSMKYYDPDLIFASQFEVEE